MSDRFGVYSLAKGDEEKNPMINSDSDSNSDDDDSHSITSDSSSESDDNYENGQSRKRQISEKTSSNLAPKRFRKFNSVEEVSSHAKENDQIVCISCDRVFKSSKTEDPKKNDDDKICKTCFEAYVALKLENGPGKNKEKIDIFGYQRENGIKTALFKEVSLVENARLGFKEGKRPIKELVEDLREAISSMDIEIPDDPILEGRKRLGTKYNVKQKVDDRNILEEVIKTLKPFKEKDVSMVELKTANQINEDLAKVVSHLVRDKRNAASRESRNTTKIKQRMSSEKFRLGECLHIESKPKTKRIAKSSLMKSSQQSISSLTIDQQSTINQQLIKDRSISFSTIDQEPIDQQSTIDRSISFSTVDQELIEQQSTIDRQSTNFRSILFSTIDQQPTIDQHSTNVRSISFLTIDQEPIDQQSTIDQRPIAVLDEDILECEAGADELGSPCNDIGLGWLAYGDQDLGANFELDSNVNIDDSEQSSDQQSNQPIVDLENGIQNQQVDSDMLDESDLELALQAETIEEVKYQRDALKRNLEEVQRDNYMLQLQNGNQRREIYDKDNKIASLNSEKTQDKFKIESLVKRVHDLLAEKEAKVDKPSDVQECELHLRAITPISARKIAKIGLANNSGNAVGTSGSPPHPLMDRSRFGREHSAVASLLNPPE